MTLSTINNTITRTVSVCFGKRRKRFFRRFLREICCCLRAVRSVDNLKNHNTNINRETATETHFRFQTSPPSTTSVVTSGTTRPKSGTLTPSTTWRRSAKSCTWSYSITTDSSCRIFSWVPLVVVARTSFVNSPVRCSFQVTHHFDNYTQKVRHNDKVLGCFYTGAVENDNKSSVTVSLCNGMVSNFQNVRWIARNFCVGKSGNFDWKYVPNNAETVNCDEVNFRTQ